MGDNDLGYHRRNTVNHRTPTDASRPTPMQGLHDLNRVLAPEQPPPLRQDAPIMSRRTATRLIPRGSARLTEI